MTIRTTLVRALGSGLVLLAAWSLPAPVRGETALLAPLQIDGVERDLSERMSEDGPPFVRVDLGTAEGGTVPAMDDFQTMTLLGSMGATKASIHDVEKTCAYLCGGEEPETCHFVARMVPHRPLEEIGTPLAALVGDHAVEQFRPTTTSAVDVPAGWPSGTPGRPVWSPHPDYPQEYRLLAAASAEFELRLEVRSGGHVESAEDRGCSLRRFDELEAVACSSFAAIVADGRPLLVSFADYNVAAAEPVASFELAGTTYHVVRLGLKAQTVYGLLVKTAGGWRGLFHPRDYALLC